MDPSHQITFRDIEPTDAIRAYVEKHIVKLGTFHSHILSCRVTLSAPHRHQRHGRHYHVALDVNVPGHELLGGRDAADKRVYEDLYAAVDDAFDGMKRALKSIAQKQRSHRTREAREDLVATARATDPPRSRDDGWCALRG